MQNWGSFHSHRTQSGSKTICWASQLLNKIMKFFWAVGADSVVLDPLCWWIRSIMPLHSTVLLLLCTYLNIFVFKILSLDMCCWCIIQIWSSCEYLWVCRFIVGHVCELPWVRSKVHIKQKNPQVVAWRDRGSTASTISSLESPIWWMSPMLRFFKHLYW